MPIPYVIDNQTSKLADVLNGILGEHAHSSLDIASAYFNIGGFKELQANLAQLRSFRLLLGFEPKAGTDVGLRPQGRVLNAALQADLAREPFTEATLRLVEDLIAFLRRPEVAVRLYEQGFLHAKCYLFYGDKGAQAPAVRPLPAGGRHRRAPATSPGQG